MKKTYSKPLIVFDSFELSQNIAAGCELLYTNQAQYACPVVVAELGSGYTFFASQPSCYATPPGGNDSICYDVPIVDNNVFNS